jgi:hypothetical protein
LAFEKFFGASNQTLIDLVLAGAVALITSNKILVLPCLVV